MIELVTLDYGTPRGMATKVRAALARRAVVRIPGFSRSHNDLIALAQQLGMTRDGSVPVVDTDHSDTYLVRMRSPVPAIVLEFCAEPMGMFRWYTDLTELYAGQISPLLTSLSQSTASYSDGTSGPLIRTSRIDNRPYAAITSDLTAIGGATPEEVAAMVAQVHNVYGRGVSDLLLDQQYDLLVHVSDGIATGQMYPALNSTDLLRAQSQQGSWLRLTVDPDWDLLTQPA